jgi:UDPglucose 6-dehydrogenase
MKIAIVGAAGFVGRAVDYGFPNNIYQKLLVDPVYNTPISAIADYKPDYVFVCVPTPMGSNGRIDASIIKTVIAEVRTLTNAIIIIKSTITPDVVKYLFDKYEGLVYNPEFLTEKSANEDFVNPFMHVFGGDPAVTTSVEWLYKLYSLCKPCPVYHMSAIDASFVKYGVNSFLASKVLWFNQFHDLVTDYGGSYNTVVNAVTSDSRVGRSHTTVPGFDGRRGFSGSCFPKDSMALVKFAREQNTPFTVLEEVVRRNQDYRNNQGDLLPREIEQKVKFDFII